VKRVLVTGASGFIGRFTLRPLVDRGYDVHALRRSPVDEPGPAGVTWHELDLLDHGATSAFVADLAPSHLLHLAWYTAHGRYWNAQENLDWVAASLNLVRRFNCAGGVRAVVAGTSAEYDWSGDCCTGSTPLGPSSFYGVSKNALREILEAYARESGLGLAWGRVFYTFGPGEQPTRVVAAVARALTVGESIACSRGGQLRDFLYVADVGAAFAALLDSKVTGAIDIGSGKGIALAELLRRLETLAGRPGLVRLGAAPPRDEPQRIVANVRRLREEVRWEPAWGLDASLAETLGWWRSRAPSA
jgi:nucleoside-diphosphate-sugar epimerase